MKTPFPTPPKNGSGTRRIHSSVSPWTGSDPDLWLYRDRTTALLRRYLRLSIESGRIPALLGREFFRTRVTSYSTHTFEDLVIFVHDVERCLDLLSWADKAVIATVVLEEQTRKRAAELLGCTSRTIARRLPDALDKVSEIFLERGILQPFANHVRASSPACQEEESDELCVTGSI